MLLTRIRLFATFRGYAYVHKAVLGDEAAQPSHGAVDPSQGFLAGPGRCLPFHFLIG